MLGLLSEEGSCREFDCCHSSYIYVYDEWQLSNSEQYPYTLNKLYTSNLMTLTLNDSQTLSNIPIHSINYTLLILVTLTLNDSQ